jgi:hypothetical protein
MLSRASGPVHVDQMLIAGDLKGGTSLPYWITTEFCVSRR